MNVIIRNMTINDCESFCKIVTLGWNQNYQGIVNDTFLQSLIDNEPERIINTKNNFSDFKDNTLILEVDSKVVGFAKYGISDYKGYQNSGELNSIYIIEGYKGLGYGKKLFMAIIEKLLEKGYKDMIVGCLDKNKSNGFYIHLGGEKIGTQIIKRGSQDLVENIYYFKDLKTTKETLWNL